MGAAVAVILMKERQIVEAFERAGATTAHTGRSPTELAVDPDGIGWRRLRERAVVREASPGTGLYYLDVEVWQATRRTRRRVLAVVFIVMLALLVVLVTGGHFGAAANR
jgi:hypothetical protein